ncbi:sensor histidine kinase [Hyphomicrobiales bacterium]|nr:sensor histidine kinase [Hyphomicrobiales bacterium]
MESVPIYNKLFSSLTKRIITLNLFALIILLCGILYTNQFKEGLIEAKIESLLTQGEIIAGAISTSASVSSKISYYYLDEDIRDMSSKVIKYTTYQIDPELALPIITKLIDPNRMRTIIHNDKKEIILDSINLFTKGQIKKYDVPLIENNSIYYKIYNSIKKVNLFRELNPSINSNDHYDSVFNALNGKLVSLVSKNETNESVVIVAVPIKKFQSTLGILVLTTQGGGIDNIVNSERKAIFGVFLVAAFVTIILSLILSHTIGKPVRQLASAADNVKKDISYRKDIPDFSQRNDEIGDLSIALKEMTKSLYDRIEAIENFSADVSHELKNPLTSLRSAIEAFKIVKNGNERKKLINVIQSDIDRIDRLITDISAASRLDAELSLEHRAPFNLVKLIRYLVEVEKNKNQYEQIHLYLSIDEPEEKMIINGHEERMRQVFVNLFDNAKSFSRKNDPVVIKVSNNKEFIKISVQDNGPGIKGSDINKIFDRFYTDRPDDKIFGTHSGLGLSIAKQIIKSHGGDITVLNNSTLEKDKRGAVFKITIKRHLIK